MIQVYLRDADWQPVFPFSLLVQSVPSRGDKISYWDSGNPEQGGWGMRATVAQVMHSLSSAKIDHVIFLVLTDLQTIDAENKPLPPKTSSDSDAVGQSDAAPKG
jgi:hypothetical protein